MGEHVTIEELQIPPDFLVPQNRKGTQKTKQRINGRFIKGPLPWDWLCRAAALTEKSLHVGLGLWFISGLRKSLTVKMQKRVLSELQVSRRSFYKAVDRMVEAGLVLVTRNPGQTYVITLLLDENETLNSHPLDSQTNN